MKKNLHKCKRIMAILLAIILVATSVTITPNYAEAATTKKSIKKAKVTGIKKTYEYTGKTIKPKIKVKLKKKKLKNKKAYTVKYSKNTNVGKAKITIKGKGKYKGTIKKSFKITARPISKAVVTLSQDKYTYTGSPCTPEVTVADGTKKLVAAKDYTVRYTNNVNAGTATVTVTGIGNYNGTATAKFTIAASDNTSTETKTTEDKTTENTTAAPSTTEEAVDPKPLKIDISGFAYDKTSTLYTVDEVVNTLNGTLSDKVTAEEITIEVTDAYEDVVFSKTIPAASEWKVEDFGLVVGANYVSAKVVDQKENTYEDRIIIINKNKENMTNTTITDKDRDSDGISDYNEKVFGTNPKKKDSDGDGISDYDELFVTFTDPAKKDADSVDSDMDGITDIDETTKYNTDPNKADSDDDGIFDSDEIKYGLDPLKNDSTASVNASFSDPAGNVSINLNCKAKELNSLKVDQVPDKTTDAVIGVPVAIISTINFTTADIVFSYDTEALGDISEEDLRIAIYNEVTNRFEVLETSVIDTENKTVSYKANRCATYALVNRLAVRTSSTDALAKLDEANRGPLFYDSNSEHQYMVMYNVSSWQEAKDLCESFGGHLLTITDATEQSVIETFLSQEQSAHDAMNYYIGGCREGSTFTWITGEAFDYSNVSDTTFIKKKINLSINGLEDGFGTWSFVADTLTACICEWDTTDKRVDMSQIDKTCSPIQINSTNKHSYMGIYTGYQSYEWEDAEKLCEQLGGHLVTITDEDEQTFLADFMQNENLHPSTYLIGIYSKSAPSYDGLPYDYKWITGEPFDYTNWAAGEPNFSNERFGEMYGTNQSKFSQWNNTSAGTTSFICEWDYEAVAYNRDKLTYSDKFIKAKRLTDIPESDAIINRLNEEVPDVNLDDYGYTDLTLMNYYLCWISELIGVKAISEDSPLTVELFENYLYKTSDTYSYDCSRLNELTPLKYSDYNLYKLYNMNQLKQAFIESLEEGETITLATRSDADFCGLNMQSSTNNQSLLNPDSCFSVQRANAVFVSKCTLQDGVYSFTTNYYLLDCYDFEPTNDLYLLNAKGLAKNFVSIGKDSFEGTFTADGAITIK